MECQVSRIRPALVCFTQTLVVLFVGLVPIPHGWALARSVLQSVRSSGLNQADRETTAGGYYQGLIGVDGPAGAPSALAQRLMGKPAEGDRFTAANVSRGLPGDFLLFELVPNVNRPLLGHRFTTNAFGMRDRPYTLAKPEGTFRIAVLGASMDMGWGVGTESTYVNLLEDWLDAHLAKGSPIKRFEILNFAVAAYSPMQRLETFRRKARKFDPDLVLFSATTLDLRLMEIHLCGLLEHRFDLRYDFIRRAVAEACVTEQDLRLDAEHQLVDKPALKAKLREIYWPLYDATMNALEGECRSIGIPLACMIIPRVGKVDAPKARAAIVARLRATLDRHADAVFDLSDTFDAIDPVLVETSAWDDHPNALGHQRLFRALTHALVKDSLFGPRFLAGAQDIRVPAEVQ